MAYDEALASRIAKILEDTPQVEPKKMFGGIAFMVKEHMCVGVINTELMARVGPENYEAALTHTHAREMNFTGKPLKGMVYVSQEGISSDADLREWIDKCLAFVNTLPAKQKPSGKKASRKKG